MNNDYKLWDKLANKYDIRVKKKYSKAYKDTIELTKTYLDPSQKTLDIGCGTGITTIELSKYVKEIDSIDTSQSMINKAIEKSKGLKNVNYHTIDIFNKKLNNKKYDVIFCFNVLPFLENLEKSLKRINSLLKDSGLFISATDCSKENSSLTMKLYPILSKLKILPSAKYFTKKELENKIKKNGFEITYKKSLFENPPNYYIVAKKNNHKSQKIKSKHKK